MQTSMLVRPQHGIDPEAQAVHGISREDCDMYGVSPSCAVQLFLEACQRAHVVVAHNLAFDDMVMEAAMLRACGNHDNILPFKKSPASHEPQRVCTMKSSTNVLKLPGKWNKSHKWPSLQEAYSHFAVKKEGEEENSIVIERAHDALVDAEACLVVFRGLVESGAIALPDISPDVQLEAQSNSNVVDVLESPAAAATTATITATTTIITEKETMPLGIISAQRGELCVNVTEEGFQVSGQTFKHKETLKLFGARWNPSDKAWEFNGHSMLDPIKQFANISMDDSKDAVEDYNHANEIDPNEIDPNDHDFSEKIHMESPPSELFPDELFAEKVVPDFPNKAV